MKFLQLSVFGLQTDDSNPKFQSVNEKRVHHETYKRYWGILHPNLTKFSSGKIESSPLHFHFIRSKNWKLRINWLAAKL